jgi:CheY-like chemotaxis protein
MGTPSKHILLIDDEDDIREVAAMSLETAAGWRVTCASSGAEGVKLAEHARPDAILLDVMMPDQDGAQILRMLRHNESTKSIPVVFLTAKVHAIERQRLEEIGAAGTLAKPFDPMKLADQIAQTLGW